MFEEDQGLIETELEKKNPYITPEANNNMFMYTSSRSGNERTATLVGYEFKGDGMVVNYRTDGASENSSQYASKMKGVKNKEGKSTSFGMKLKREDGTVEDDWFYVSSRKEDNSGNYSVTINRISAVPGKGMAKIETKTVSKDELVLD